MCNCHMLFIKLRQVRVQAEDAIDLFAKWNCGVHGRVQLVHQYYNNATVAIVIISNTEWCNCVNQNQPGTHPISTMDFNRTA